MSYSCRTMADSGVRWIRTIPHRTSYHCTKPPTIMLKAKFHYAIWSQTGSKLVADLQRAGIWPIIWFASSELARGCRSATGPRPASNLSATSFEQVRASSTCRRPVQSQIPLRYLVADRSEADRRQVRSWSRTCRRPASAC